MSAFLKAIASVMIITFATVIATAAAEHAVNEVKKPRRKRKARVSR